MELGALIRKTRRVKDLTLQQVASGVGFSVGYISSVERGIIAPSANALKAICEFLDISPEEAHEEERVSSVPKPAGLLVRSGQRKRFAHPDSNASYELLSPDFRHAIEFLKVTAQPGDRGGDPPFSHEGEEIVVVIKGMVEMHVGDEVHLMEEGDAIYVTDSRVPHYWVAVGDEELQMYGCVVPPSF